MFLQAKEAGRAVLEEFVGGSEYANCLQRSASASCSDISLGWVRAFERGVDAFARAYADQNERDHHALGRRGRFRSGHGGVRAVVPLPR